MVLETVKEWRLGRNFIRVGDVVKVLPPPDRKGTSFEAIVREIAVEGGEVKHVEVLGGKKGRLAIRFVTLDRIKRVAQVRTDGDVVTRRERKR